MGAATSMVIFIPEGMARAKAVKETHLTLVAAGAELDTSEWGILGLGSYDFYPDDDEVYDLSWDAPDDTPNVEGEADLQKIIDYPTMGSIDYMFFGGSFTVNFNSLPYQPVEGIQMWLHWSRSFSSNIACQEWFRKVGKELHDKFEAKRTFMAWGISDYMNVEVNEELARLKKGMVDTSKTFEYFDFIRK
jgi:hypothetical protein